ncbi:sporulated oocyst TA4 antigen-like [Cyclospora cayetanensis]|uniref:Sporulated oocyst TA4 antigen-like n=1 Tax=Cyclospora cayetanensis TaxID=88456 RepID=A0A6P6RVA6_9EIME|nr:sporulated oocyst TA4 antigen-like [Cyclospora cayetanensis]
MRFFGDLKKRRGNGNSDSMKGEGNEAYLYSTGAAGHAGHLAGMSFCGSLGQGSHKYLYCSPNRLQKMAPFSLLSLASASLLLAHGAFAEDTSVGTEVDCTTAMNALRKKAGLEAFTIHTSVDAYHLPVGTHLAGDKVTTDKKEEVKELCTKILGNTADTSKRVDGDKVNLVAVQEGLSADCSAAVDYWRGAFPTFTGKPQKFTGNQYDGKQVSFLGLLNPKSGASVNCAYYNCAKESGEGSFNGLICRTQMNVNDGELFTDEQWDKIVQAFDSGAAALPTMMAIGAAFVGLFVY